MRCFRILILLSAGLSLSASAGASSFHSTFIRHLLNNSDSLIQYLHPDELRMVDRLGVQYEGVKHKWLIGYDFDDDVKNKVRAGELLLVPVAEELGNSYSRLTLRIDGHGERRFLFDNRRVISPISYHTRSWSLWESEHFSFRIRDTTLFHPEATKELERFLLEVVTLLQFSNDDMDRLRSAKIVYVLCRDEEEIERLTGFRSRGMYLLSHDYIVTTYSCHYHELLHLLINFKLKRLPLFTHPFLQEGFAVGLGGRGGIAIQSLMESGRFLVQSGMVDQREFFSAQGFRAEDPSITYPVAGLYNRFLMWSIGIKRYLDLYLKYSGDALTISTVTITPEDLPDEAGWLDFLGSVEQDRMVVLSGDTQPGELIMKSDGVEVEEMGDFYRFRVSSRVTLKPHDAGVQYQSKRFGEFVRDRPYRGERYLIHADSVDSTIVDLYTNNTIAGYTAGFALPPVRVPMAKGMYEFLVKKEVFSGHLREYSILR